MERMLKAFKKTQFVLCCLAITSGAYAQGNIRSFPNDAFQVGEFLSYRMHYGLINAGIASLEVKEIKKIGTRSTFHIVGLGRTTGAWDWVFRVRDRYETFIDSSALIPWVFVRRVNEGGYILNQDVVFDQINKTAKSKKGQFEVPENVQDILSAFYYARCLDYDNAAVGDTFSVSTFLDDEVFMMSVIYRGKDTLKTKLGRFACIKLQPSLLEGRVFRDEDDLTVWISDDKNRIPIRGKTEILVGSIKMDLTEYKGLAHPLAKLD